MTSKHSQRPAGDMSSKATSPTAKEPLAIYQDGEWTVLHARPSGVGGGITFMSWFLGGVLAFPVFAICVRGGMPVIIGFVVFALIAFVISKGYLGMLQRGRKVQSQPFAIGPQGVRLPDGTVIPESRIAAWNIRHTSAGRSVVVQNTGAGRAGDALRRGLVDKNYVVEIEHGGLSSPLAGGLTVALASETRWQATNRLHELREQDKRTPGTDAWHREEMARWKTPR